MGAAYTPGLTVSAKTTVNKLRRLPLKGTVVVKQGDAVEPKTVVARTELPGLLQTVKIADRLGIEPPQVPEMLCVEVGDVVQRGDLLARSKGLFGRFFRNSLYAPFGGKVEFLSRATGNLGIREAPLPVERTAYIRGTIEEVIPEEGVIVRCEGALIQGIFGVGGERLGEIAIAAGAPDSPLQASDLSEAHRGKIVVGGPGVTPEALRAAAHVGVAGIVVGGIVDHDLMSYLAEALNEPGFDIGVAITGQEAVPYTLILTEGFGEIRMAERTFRLLQSLEGQTASINGATQIRAGVIRPEVIVPRPADYVADGDRVDNAASGVAAEWHDRGGPASASGTKEGSELAAGTPIRLIREPWFGQLATVTSLPTDLTQVESGTWVRVLEARLASGTIVIVPRANVEIIETG